MKNILICVLLLCLSASCKEAKELNPTPREFDQKMTLVPTDTLTIPIGYRSDVYSRYVKTCNIGNVPYLGVVNVNTNDLEFYALSDKGEDFKVRFHLDGPNAVGQLMAFEVISDSTLLIASTYRIRLYVTDFEGNVIKTIKTDDTSRKGKPYVQMYYTQRPLVYHKSNDDFYVFTKVDTDYNGPGIWSGTMFMKIANSVNEPIQHILELPTFFNDFVHGAFFSHGSHVLIEDRYLVLGIPFYNNILIYDLEKEELIEKEAGSRHFGDALPWEHAESGNSESFYVPSNSYREIAYDEENKLLYRLAYQGVDYIGPDGEQRNWDNKLPSVIMINSDFEKVGEVDLPLNTIYTRMYFTHNGKLYLSLNHPDNSPSEDKMVFVGFKPEKL
ncbi:DUF4221 family protein [uncultured Cyclobacterium sp.]|uniref:DUF4221 family protein n=1 Tax=uncultured Cyclobacterium sp. TaxID=453820 RepID=UPI0030ED4923|tara:strand:- start:1724 stop:2881 length:1158 start_codon:yes stop_codon:yes gene_type:complete